MTLTFETSQNLTDHYQRAVNDGSQGFKGDMTLRFISVAQMYSLAVPGVVIGYRKSKEQFFAAGLDIHNQPVAELKEYIDVLTQPYVEFGFDLSPSPLEGDTYLRLAPKPLYLGKDDFSSQSITRHDRNV